MCETEDKLETSGREVVSKHFLTGTNGFHGRLEPFEERIGGWKMDQKKMLMLAIGVLGEESGTEDVFEESVENFQTKEMKSHL